MARHLAEVWGAIPAIADTPGPNEVRRPLYVEAVDEDYPMSAMEGQVKAAAFFPVGLKDPDLQDFIKLYPGASDAKVTMEAHVTAMGFGRVIVWPGLVNPRERLSRFYEVTSFDPATEDRWLMPGIGHSNQLLHLLLLWWLLLFGFSMLARYEPRRWRQLLDVDESRWAVAIETSLDAAIDVLPALVLHVLP